MRRIHFKNLILVMFALILLVIFGLYLYVTGDTTTDFRYGYRMESVLEEYTEFAELTDMDSSFAIPGLARTNVTPQARVTVEGSVEMLEAERRHSTRTMVPQGICFAGQFVLISAYDSKAEYPSVLYVLDRDTKEYRTTVLLEDKNHVGGIAYDGEFVWIAKSGDCALSAISYDRIKLAADAGEDCVSVYYDDTYAISCRASFVTYYDGLLWVGVFEKADNRVSVLRGFEFHDKEGVTGLLQKDELFLPEQANGAAITKVNGHICLIVDTSYGRLKASKVHVYELSMDENNFESAVCLLKAEYDFPPMLEEVECNGRDIYYVFESGATTYSTKWSFRCKYPVDRVCVTGQDTMFAWTDKDEIQESEIMVEETRDETVNMQYHVSTAKEAKYIPTYVRTDMHQGVQMLYNPYTARLLYNVVQDSQYMTSKTVVGEASWNDTLSKNGYSNLQAFHHQDLWLDARHTVPVDVATGIVRQAAYNDQEKFNIVIAIHTENVEDLDFDPDALTYYYHNDVLNGVYQNAVKLYNRLQKLQYEVPVVIRSRDRAVITYKTVRFSSLIKAMKKPDSKYTVTVTGAGIAGAVADVLTGMIFTDKGIYEGNVNCYTFDTMASALKDTYEGTNIFNLVMEYGHPESLTDHVPYGGRIQYQAQMETEQYVDMLNAIEQNPTQYVRYNTDLPAKFYGHVTIDADCFAHFRELRVANTLYIPDGVCVFAGQKFYVYNLTVEGEIEAHKLFYAKFAAIHNGRVRVDGISMIGNVTNAIRGRLEITGADGLLEINGERKIPYVSCTPESLAHIKTYNERYRDTSSDNHSVFWKK